MRNDRGQRSNYTPVLQFLRLVSGVIQKPRSVTSDVQAMFGPVHCDAGESDLAIEGGRHVKSFNCALQ